MNRILWKNFSFFEAIPRYRVVLVPLVLKEAIHQVNYGLKYRGYYQDGHMQALNDIEKVLDQYNYDLDELSDQIKIQTKEIKHQYKDYKKAYITGYIDGLEYVQKAILKSKHIMMEKIINEIK